MQKLTINKHDCDKTKCQLQCSTSDQAFTNHINLHGSILISRWAMDNNEERVENFVKSCPLNAINILYIARRG